MDSVCDGNNTIMWSLDEQRPWKDILSTASIWYDYLSIPQLSEGPTCNLNEQDTANAIASIANYIGGDWEASL